MAAALVNDGMDLVTCGICYLQYDSETRKPKFLQCSHTLCSTCVKEIHMKGVICCPFCQLIFFNQSVDSLPNNNYAVKLLGLIEDAKQTSSKSAPSKPESMSWCLICQSEDSSLCTTLGHLTITMTTETTKNLEQMIQLKSEMMELKDQGINTLAQIIQKRRQIQEHLSLVMRSIRFAEEEVKKLQDDNDFILTKTMSILEQNKQTIPGNLANGDQLIAEVKSMVEDFHPNDPAETLKLKLKNSIDVYSKYLQEANSIASNYERVNKTKISVVLHDEDDRRIPTCPTLDKGFRFNNLNLTQGNKSRQDLMLLSHSIFGFLEKQSSEPIESLAQTNSQPKLSPIPSSGFIIGQSVFILKMYRSGNVTDEICIRPCATFNNEFVQKLGTHCYKSPKKLRGLFKGVYDIYVVISSAQTIPDCAFPDAAQYNNSSAKKALDVNEVGLSLIKSTSKDQTQIEWNMIFPLKNFKNPKCASHVSSYIRSELFGKLLRNESKTLTKLSSTSSRERPNITFTLESV